MQPLPIPWMDADKADWSLALPQGRSSVTSFDRERNSGEEGRLCSLAPGGRTPAGKKVLLILHTECLTLVFVLGSGLGSVWARPVGKACGQGLFPQHG